MKNERNEDFTFMAEDNSYIVFTDSCADLDMASIEEARIVEAPMTYVIEGKTYYNYYDPSKIELNVHDFFEKMRNGEVAKTSQIGPGRFLEVWDPYLKEGKDILYVCFSSALSGTINSANQAKEYLKDNYPDRKIVIVDSLAASCGLGILAYQAGLNRLNGMSIEENREWIENHRLHLSHWFTIDSLATLKRGGRLSASKAFLGTMLRLKPVLHVDNEGRLVPMQTVRGRKQALQSIIEHFGETAMEPEKNRVVIGHADDIVTAKFLGDKLQETYHPKEIRYQELGPVIGAHSGPNTIVLFFWATER